jgi:hypothetical protein
MAKDHHTPLPSPPHQPKKKGRVKRDKIFKPKNISKKIVKKISKKW